VASRESIVGTLVHRLIRASERLARASGSSAQLAIASGLLEPEERVASGDPSAIVVAALDAYRRFRLEPALMRLLNEGERVHELPFSLVEQGAIVRGAIDCLIRKPDGGVTVLEFKSGSPSADHRIQLDLYVRAARSMFPDARVEGRLVYL
jgi:hypothetical protein